MDPLLKISEQLYHMSAEISDIHDMMKKLIKESTENKKELMALKTEVRKISKSLR